MSRHWITDRHSQTGRGLNSNPGNNGSGKGPLRKVSEVLILGDGGMFGRDKCLLECGHEVWGTKGSRKVRCRLCKAKEEKERT